MSCPRFSLSQGASFGHVGGEDELPGGVEEYVRAQVVETLNDDDTDEVCTCTSGSNNKTRSVLWKVQVVGGGQAGVTGAL